MSDFETESQEDRIKWLRLEFFLNALGNNYCVIYDIYVLCILHLSRERGVQIELPEERKNAAVNFSSAKVQR